MTGYTDTIRKYAIDDSHAGLLHQADGVGEVGLSSAEAGRKLAVRFTLRVSNDRIERARYQVFGCGFTIAACAATAELIEGQPLTELSTVNAATIDRHLGGLPGERSYCADLAIEALRAAVSSLGQQSARVTTTFQPLPEHHGSRITAGDPVYRALMKSSSACKSADRHLFACLLAVADQDMAPLHQALGLTAQKLDALLDAVFPHIDRRALFADPELKTATPPDVNQDILNIVLSYTTPGEAGHREFLADTLAQSLSARAAHPGHLWVAMGLFERPQLSAAIGRHLPSLLKANHKGMRWKRFLFKQVCEQQGGMMCKSPDCGDCSDYALCFAPDDSVVVL